MLTSDVLVLNSSYVPISIVSAKRAVHLLIRGKAKVVEESSENVASTTFSMKVPTVIAVHYNSLPKKTVRFSKQNVIYRDDMTCMYCGKRGSMKELTIDHIIPISRWLTVAADPTKRFSSWENCVCACEDCNSKKGSKLLSELHWKLRREPFEPKYMPYFVISKTKAENKGWLPFCKYNVRIVDIIEK